VDPDESTNRPTGATIENARILHEHGVPVAVAVRGYISTGGMAGRDLQHLPMEAAYAVRGGLPDKEAIKAITINPARILGIDDRVGSIEIGKDADFIIVDGDLLHYQTHVRWTVVNGRIAYDRLKDTLFDHLPSDLEDDIQPPVDHWPRSLGEEW
jgi:imidazolonepropionase-like amidohydrolase